MPTGHLKFRTAFGNVSRLFRGARYGDPIDPFGPPYVKDGLVLDYSTDVGPFTIVDQSPEGNDATLYSGRGVTMDGVADTITYPTGYSSAEREATVWMRVSSLGARTLNGATGSFTFTPTATGVWEQLSDVQTVSGDLSWTAGSDCDISELTVGSEHWTHADWSDPTATGLNGRDVVDSGPSDFHGTCTGCSGFTEEDGILQTAVINWNKYDWNGGVPILSDSGDMLVPASDADDQVDAYGSAILEPRLNDQVLNLFGDGEHSRTAASSTIDLITEATWEIWGELNESVTGNTAIVAKNRASGGNRSWEIIRDNGTGNGFAKISLSPDGTSVVFTTFPVPMNVGQLVIVFDGAGATDADRMKIYNDGVEVVPTLLSAPTGIATTTIDLTIGMSDNASRYWGGAIGTVRLYNRALPPEEVSANYEATKSLYGL